uniref:Uncharacterized protein n=1 Tax=Arundo donax TaxID=35708 RepID=A0A0A9BL52_ARUDO
MFFSMNNRATAIIYTFESSAYSK